MLNEIEGKINSMCSVEKLDKKADYEHEFMRPVTAFITFQS